MNKAISFCKEHKLQIAYVLVGLLVVFFLLRYFNRHIYTMARSTGTVVWFTVILVAMLALFFYFLYFVLTKKKFSYTHMFVVVTIGWGIIFQMVVPPLSGTDEWVHYTSAYYLSDMILGTTTDSGNLVMRLEDANNWTEIDCNYPDQYEVIANQDGIVSAKNAALTEVNTEFYTMWIRYIPTGFGIALARILHLGFAWTVYLGRAMNTVLFLVIGLVALKLIPVGRMQVVSMAMIPLLMEQVTSFTYDALSNTLCILVAALCLYYSREEVKFKIWDILILAISFMFLLPNKGVYIAYAICIFMIPWRKWKAILDKALSNRRNKIAALIVLASCVVIFCTRMLNFFAGYVRIFSKTTGTAIEQYDDRAAWTIGYALSHKTDTLWLWWHTFSRFGFYYVETLLGKAIGNHNLDIAIPENYIVLILLTIIAGLLIRRGKSLDKKKRIIWTIAQMVTLLFICLGCMIRFTPTDTEVLQLSGRYLLPLFSVGMIMFGTDQEENYDSLQILFWQNLILIPILCYVLCDLLNRLPAAS